MLNISFDSEVTTKPPITLTTLYVSLTATDIPVMQANYNDLTDVTSAYVPNTLQSFAEDKESHCFLVCTAASFHHQEPCIH